MTDQATSASLKARNNAFRTAIQKGWLERAEALGFDPPRGKKLSPAKSRDRTDALLHYLTGAMKTLQVLGETEKLNALSGLAFLASVRGHDEFERWTFKDSTPEVSNVG